MNKALIQAARSNPFVADLAARNVTKLDAGSPHLVLAALRLEIRRMLTQADGQTP